MLASAPVLEVLLRVVYVIDHCSPLPSFFFLKILFSTHLTSIKQYSVQANTSNPQFISGYWNFGDGNVCLKQWGSRLSGGLNGEIDDSGKVLLSDGRVMEIKDCELYVDGKKEGDRVSPKLVVICGPSGVGKGTLLAKLFKEFPDEFGFCVSHTTRNPRPGEVNGVDYHFTTKENIKSMISNSDFVEYAEVHGNYYGTSKAAIQAVQEKGKICVLDIDVQGARKVAAASLPFVGIFIKPPSREELERRLRGRGTETEEKVQKRLHNSLDEIKFCNTHEFFWYELINNDLDKCYVDFVSAVAQGTQSQKLPAVPHSIDATPNCGCTPSAA